MDANEIMNNEATEEIVEKVAEAAPNGSGKGLIFAIGFGLGIAAKFGFDKAKSFIKNRKAAKNAVVETASDGVNEVIDEADAE